MRSIHSDTLIRSSSVVLAQLRQAPPPISSCLDDTENIDVRSRMDDVALYKLSLLWVNWPDSQWPQVLTVAEALESAQ